MALKKVGRYSAQEVEYIKTSREEGVNWVTIAKKLKRNPQTIMRKYYRLEEPKVIRTVDTKDLNSVTLNVKGVEITMVFK
jgi:IS30 family transposase